MPTVFFLSDYGTQDEFVGVVHSVLTRIPPAPTVIDLTHAIAPFDVRAGSHALVRAVPYLGAGVVLAVVDPGVGSARRGLCIRVDAPGDGPTYFVGPDNGLLMAAAECAGEAPVTEAFVLRPGLRPDHGRTFDGRDLFAPAAAALSRGASPFDVADPVDPTSLVRLFGAVVEQGRHHDGRPCLRAEVTWVDRFGNVQLAATVADARAAGIPLTGSVAVTARTEGGLDGSALPLSLVPESVALRCVQSFADLGRGELGLLVDANGHLAVVAGEASAAGWLSVAAGELMVLTW